MFFKSAAVRAAEPALRLSEGASLFTLRHMDWTQRISVGPSICHGPACIRGTRVMVSVVLGNLAAGLTPSDIVRSYPSLHLDDIAAAMCYVAELARERAVVTPIRFGFCPDPELSAARSSRNL